MDNILIGFLKSLWIKISENLVAWIAVIVSLTIGIFQCNQANRIENLTSTVNSISFQPRMDLIRIPQLGKFSINIFDKKDIPPISFTKGHIFIDTNRFFIKDLKSKGIWVYPKKEYLEENRKLFWDFIVRNSDTASFVLNDTTVTIPIKLDIINIGNSLGKLLFYAYAGMDTINGKRTLQTHIMNRINDTDSVSMKYECWDDFFKNNLLPKDSTEIQINFNPKYIKDGRFILHFILFYKNELGIISDTYFWIVYDNFPMLFEKELEFDNKNKKILSKIKVHDDPSKRFKIVNYNKDFKLYSLEESEKITRWLEELSDYK